MKEFITNVIKYMLYNLLTKLSQGFDLKKGLFIETERKELIPNPSNSN